MLQAVAFQHPFASSVLSDHRSPLQALAVLLGLAQRQHRREHSLSGQVLTPLLPSVLLSRAWWLLWKPAVLHVIVWRLITQRGAEGWLLSFSSSLLQSRNTWEMLHQKACERKAERGSVCFPL